MKYEIENLSYCYVVDVKNCKTGKDFKVKGKKAKREIAKMLVNEILRKGLVNFDAEMRFDEGLIFARGKIAILKAEKEGD